MIVNSILLENPFTLHCGYEVLSILTVLMHNIPGRVYFLLHSSQHPIPKFTIPYLVERLGPRGSKFKCLV
jgi:hypothetical protein